MTSLPYALLLGTSALVVAMLGVFASGMFPRAARPAALRGAGGGRLIGAGALLAAALAVAAAAGAAGTVPWPYAVIAAGLGVLLGPLAFQGLPQPLLDTPLGAALLCAAAAGLLGIWLAVTAL
jgi:hypothetical protein